MRSDIMKIRAVLLLLAFVLLPAKAAALPESGTDEAQEELNVKEFILDHLADAYEWQIYSDGNRHLTVSLPIILRSKETGWHIFSSSRLRHQASHLGFQIAPEGKYKGKIVERDATGQEVRP